MVSENNLLIISVVFGTVTSLFGIEVRREHEFTTKFFSAFRRKLLYIQLIAVKTLHWAFKFSTFNLTKKLAAVT